jgi:hypothetical protein
MWGKTIHTGSVENVNRRGAGLSANANTSVPFATAVSVDNEMQDYRRQHNRVANTEGANEKGCR